MSDQYSRPLLSSDQTFYDVNQAAKFLNVSAGTIRRWAQSRNLSGTKIGERGDWRFTRDALLACVNTTPAGAKYQSGGGSSVSIERHAGHIMQFYEEDSFLVNKVRQYVLDSLADDRSCVIVATQDHLAALHESLRGDLDVEQAKFEGRLAVYDVATTAQWFTSKGTIDRKVCQSTLSQILSCAASHGRPISAVSELAAFLWRRGEREMARQVEDLGVILKKEYDFTLLGAYPMDAFSEKASEDLVV
jgi:excisionase family DNA binding protein